jgi:uncharacterized membrane protein
MVGEYGLLYLKFAQIFRTVRRDTLLMIVLTTFDISAIVPDWHTPPKYSCLEAKLESAKLLTDTL